MTRLAYQMASFLLAGVLSFWSLSCGSQQEAVSPPVSMPDSLSGKGTKAVPDRWWTSFGDQQLNAMVDTALEQNFTLKSAWQRLQEARAVVDREASSLFPFLEASGRAGVRRNLGDVPEAGDLGVGLSAGYELDLWGRLRSQVEAARFRARATRSDYHAAAISLSAGIAQTWYRLIEARSELDLVKQQIETNETMLKLLEARFGTGQVRSVDILRQRQLLESTREQKLNIESRIQTLEHQLAVLMGHAPQEGVAFDRRQLPELPPLPETGIPARLIQRRPDVQRAFNRLKAADRELAAAISSQYPRLSISASVTSTANNAENLFREWALSFTGNLFAPIFRGGELRAEVDRTEAVRKQRLYEYGQAVLTAFKEVEDAVVREKKQRRQIESLQEQVKLARQTYKQLRLEYFNGISDYLDVLTALDEVQQLRRDLLDARLTLIEYRISLYRALAGPIDTGRGQKAADKNT